MRALFLFCRVSPFFTRGSARLQRLLLPHYRHFAFSTPIRLNKPRSWRPPAGTVLLGALSPMAFVELSEDDDDNGHTTSEERMLKASMDEAKRVPDHYHGIR